MLLAGCSRVAEPTVTMDSEPILEATVAITEEIESEEHWVTANGDSGSGGVALSADGRFVAFVSNASNLIAGDTNRCTSSWANPNADHPGSCRDVFLRDLDEGMTRRIGVGLDQEPPDGESWAPAMTPDGMIIAFRSAATNLVDGYAEACAAREFPDHCHGIFVADQRSGEIELIFVLSDNGGIGFSDEVEISPDGRFVLFDALGETSPLPGLQLEGRYVQLLHDRETGETRAADPDSRRALDLDLLAGEVSADRRWRVLATRESLDPGDTRRCENVQFGIRNCADLYLEDGNTGNARRIALGIDGAEPDGDHHAPSISADGRFVTFASESHNLLPELVRLCSDDPSQAACLQHIYLLDLETGEIQLVSCNREGRPAGGPSVSPRISADGSRIVFASFAPDLVPGDSLIGSDPMQLSNRDVFVYDRRSERVDVLSVAVEPSP